METSALTSQWAAVLAEALAVEETVPPGWQTTEQIAADIGKSFSHASLLVRRAVAAGHVETKKFKVRAGQMLRPVPHYRIVCTPEDFEIEPDPAPDPSEQIGQRKNVGRIGETSKRDITRNERMDRTEVPAGKRGARRGKSG